MIKLTSILIVHLIIFISCSPHSRCKLKKQEWMLKKEFYDDGTLKTLSKSKNTHSCPDLDIQIVKITTYNKNGEKIRYIKKKNFIGWGESEKIVKEKIYQSY